MADDDDEPWDSCLEIPRAFDQVKDNLYMGGIIDDTSRFKYVFCCTYDTYTTGSQQQLTYLVPFHDTAMLPPEWFLDEVTDEIIKCMGKGKTYVHCTAGVNRSGLMVALTLVKLGLQPVDAIDLLRKVRSPSVLCNKTFAQRVLDGPGSSR